MFTPKNKKQRKYSNEYRLVQIHQNIIAKLQVWLPKLTRVRCASLKKSPHLLRRVVFFGLPLHLCPPTCDHQALCLRVSFAVGWLAGGWLPTLAVPHVSTFLILVVQCRWLLFSSRGFSSQLVGCPFRVAYFFLVYLYTPSRMTLTRNPDTPTKRPLSRCTLRLRLHFITPCTRAHFVTFHLLVSPHTRPNPL